MIVVDASALTAALLDDGHLGATARDVLGADVEWAAPEHLVIETFSAVRRWQLSGRISEGRGREVVVALASIVVTTVSLGSFLTRMWELRANVSAYDAAYVAVAEALGCPLITADARLAHAVGPRCEFRIIGSTPG